MNQDRETQSEILQREMYVHISTLRDQCESLLAAKHPIEVYNHVLILRSLVGQIASTSWRYRQAL